LSNRCNITQILTGGGPDLEPFVVRAFSGNIWQDLLHVGVNLIQLFSVIDVPGEQCDQIERNLAIWAFGSLLFNQFSREQVVSAHSILMWRYHSFKFSFDVDILIFWATFSKNWAKFYSTFWSHCEQTSC
jgi:hypothetical protein